MEALVKQGFYLTMSFCPLAHSHTHLLVYFFYFDLSLANVTFFQKNSQDAKCFFVCSCYNFYLKKIMTCSEGMLCYFAGFISRCLFLSSLSVDLFVNQQKNILYDTHP